MRVLIWFTTLFALASGLAAVVPGWSDWLLLTGPCCLAALILVLRRALARRAAHGAAPAAAPTRPEKWAVIDGSNVMHWQGNTPSLTPVRQTLRLLQERGYQAGVMFDANAGHVLFGRYWHDGDFAAELGLPQDRVMVVPKGTPADPYILTAARDLRARVVSDDRFRDWAGDFPEIRTRGHLIRGRSVNGAVTLDLPEPKRPQSQPARATKNAASGKKRRSA